MLRFLVKSNNHHQDTIILPEWQAKTAFVFALYSFMQKMDYVIELVHELIVIQVKIITDIMY